MAPLSWLMADQPHWLVTQKPVLDCASPGSSVSEAAQGRREHSKQNCPCLALGPMWEPTSQSMMGASDAHRPHIRRLFVPYGLCSYLCYTATSQMKYLNEPKLRTWTVWHSPLPTSWLSLALYINSATAAPAAGAVTVVTVPLGLTSTAVYL